MAGGAVAARGSVCLLTFIFICLYLLLLLFLVVLPLLTNRFSTRTPTWQPSLSPNPLPPLPLSPGGPWLWNVSPEMMMTMMAMMSLVMDVDVVDDAGVEVDDYVDVEDHVDGASDDDVDAGAKVIAS